jgi:hypothetical protein
MRTSPTSTGSIAAQGSATQRPRISFLRGDENDFCFGVKLQVRGLTTPSSCRLHAADLGCAKYTHRFLDLTAWSLASALARSKSYKSPTYVSPNSPSQLHTQKKTYYRLHTSTFFTQCSSTNPSSPSSPQLLWPLASPPPQQGNNKATTKQTMPPPTQHRPELRPLPPVPPFAARAPRRAATPRRLSPPYRPLSRLR